jgi:hypothetical protein
MVVVIPVVIVMLIFGTIIAFAVSASNKAVSGPLEQMAMQLGVPSANPLVIQRGGRNLSVKLTPGAKNQPPLMWVTASVDDGDAPGSRGAYRESGRAHLETRPAIVFRRERWWDRFGKTVRLNHEIQTGDEEFDREVYLETNSSEDAVKQAVADRVVRDSIRSLLNTGATRVVLDPKGLTAVHSAREALPPLFEQLAGPLGEAASALPVFSAGRADKPQTMLFEGVALIAAVIGLTLSAVFIDNAPIGHEAALPGVGGGFALAGVIIVILTIALRGRSTSLRRVVLLSIAALVAVPMATYTAVVNANWRLDTSEGVDHPTHIVNAYSSRQKNTTYYYVQVQSWRPSESTVVTLGVSPGFFQQAIRNRPMVVRTRAGRFGFEWVESFHLEQ